MKINIPTVKNLHDSYFASYEPSELNGVIKALTGREYPGKTSTSQRSFDLAKRVREDGTISNLIRYFLGVQGKVVVRITPFSIETEARKKFADYSSTEEELHFAGKTFDRVFGFVNYKSREAELREIFKGAVVFDYDTVYAYNINLMASVTKNIVKGGVGLVQTVGYKAELPNRLSDGVPFYEVVTQIQCGVPLSGYEWASYMYFSLYEQRVELMKWVAVQSGLADKFKNNGTISRPLKIGEVSFSTAPEDTVNYLKMCSYYQAARGKDTASLSYMTYSMYGQDYGPDMTLAENLTGLRLYISFLRTVTEIKGQYLCYMTESERELMCAGIILNESEIKMKLYHDRSHLIEGHPPIQGNFWNFENTFLYDPKTVSQNGFMVNKDDQLKEYDRQQLLSYEKRHKIYREAKYASWSQHMTGLEKHCIGMPAPHNLIGIICPNHDKGDPVLWRNLVMVSTIYRNYYQMTRISFLKVVTALKSKIDMGRYMAMTDIPFVKFTRAQKSVLNEFLMKMNKGIKISEDLSQQDYEYMESLIMNDEKMREMYTKEVADSVELLQPKAVTIEDDAFASMEDGERTTTPQHAPVPTAHAFQLGSEHAQSLMSTLFSGTPKT